MNLLFSMEGRMTGEAYVELQTEEDFKQALRKHHHYIGSRYIDGGPLLYSRIFFLISGRLT